MQKNNISSDTLCFGAREAKWEHWRGLQTPACPRASLLPAYPVQLLKELKEQDADDAQVI